MMQGDVFVAASYREVEYCKRILAEVIKIHPNSIKWLSVGDIIHSDKARAFMRSATFHIDHAVGEHLYRLPESQRSIYYETMAKLSERHKIVTWELLIEQEKKQDA